MKVKCPLWRKPVDAVCPTCNWYMTVPMQTQGVMSEEKMCAIVASARIGYATLQKTQGMKKTVEQLRNNTATPPRGDTLALCRHLLSMPNYPPAAELLPDESADSEHEQD